jgi:hypothetical protein
MELLDSPGEVEDSFIDTDVANDPRSTAHTAVDQPRVLAF